MAKYRGILVDTITNTSPNVHNTINDTTIEVYDYHNIADAIHCDYIECVKRCFGDDYVDIYCDEEGALKENVPSVAVFRNNALVEVIYGSVFLCLHNSKGEMKHLPKRMRENIINNHKTVVGYKGQNYMVLRCTL